MPRWLTSLKYILINTDRDRGSSIPPLKSEFVTNLLALPVSEQLKLMRRRLLHLLLRSVFAAAKDDSLNTERFSTPFQTASYRNANKTWLTVPDTVRLTASVTEFLKKF